MILIILRLVIFYNTAVMWNVFQQVTLILRADFNAVGTFSFRLVKQLLLIFKFFLSFQMLCLLINFMPSLFLLFVL